MDQGVIRSLKAKYRTLLVERYIRTKGMKNPLPNICVLNAMDMIVTLWNLMITKTIIANCFAKAGLSAEKQEQALEDELMISSKI